jgi:hypothetical protein
LALFILQPMMALADTFKMSCLVEGMVDVPDGKKFPPSKLTVEIGSIGKNVFMNLEGPKPYDMRVSSLVTDKFQGKNLTNEIHLGVSSKNLQTGEVDEVSISRDKVFLTAFKEMNSNGSSTRIVFQGPCQLPR